MSTLRNIIVPEVFSPYMADQANEVSKIIQSGAVVTDNSLSAFLAGGGSTVEMPVWDALDGVHTFNADSVDPLIQASMVEHSAKSEIAVRVGRNLHVGASKFLSALSGTNVVEDVARQAGGMIAAQRQGMLLSHLTGLFTTGGALESQIVTSAAWDVDLLAEAEGLMGHFSDASGTLFVNSADMIAIRKEGLVSYQGISPTTGQTLSMPNVAGYTLIVDDTVPAGEMFLVKNGAVGMGTVGANAYAYLDEKGSNGAGTEVLALLDPSTAFHVYGTSYVGGGSNPSNAELATAGSFSARASMNKIGVKKIVITG